MKGRLTVRNFENEACCALGGCHAYEDCYECPGFQDILAKLAHYEDMEEAGRLVELPEVFDEKKLFRVLSYSACPNVFNLPRSEKCPVIPCKDCWENALKIKG